MFPSWVGTSPKGLLKKYEGFKILTINLLYASVKLYI